MTLPKHPVFFNERAPGLCGTLSVATRSAPSPAPVHKIVPLKMLFSKQKTIGKQKNTYFTFTLSFEGPGAGRGGRKEEGYWREQGGGGRRKEGAGMGEEGERRRGGKREGLGF